MNGNKKLLHEDVKFDLTDNRLICNELDYFIKVSQYF